MKSDSQNRGRWMIKLWVLYFFTICNKIVLINMGNTDLKPLMEKYRDKSGLLDLGAVLNHADDLGIENITFKSGYKKLSKLVLPNQSKFYVKPTSYHGASAERIIAEVYQKSGIIAPNTTIANLNGDFYTVTNDVLPTDKTESGEGFLKNITAGGAQYALPRVFGNETSDLRVMSFFEPEVLEQIAQHYGLALATRNWDANLGGLGFTLQNDEKKHAKGLIAFDFEQSLETPCHAGYANPFEPCRISMNEIVYYYNNLRKPFIQKDKIADKIMQGLDNIDEIVRESKDEGFNPDKTYTENLKFAMDETANTLTH